MKRAHFPLILLSLSLLAAPASAQSFDNTVQASPAGARIQVGIVVPMGGGGTDAERAPRLEAWSDHRSQRSLPQASLGLDFDPPKAQPMRIGVNFTGDARLMLNGRELPEQERRKGISTLGWVGIGVGVAVIVFSVGALDAFNRDNGGNGIF